MGSRDFCNLTYSITVELLITHSLIWEFKGLFNSKFPNSIMHYEQFDCTVDILEHASVQESHFLPFM